MTYYDGLSITDREMQVLEMMFRGSTNKEIGNKLGISPATVKNHVQKIIRKSGVKPGAEGRVRCVYYALRKGLLLPPTVELSNQGRSAMPITLPLPGDAKDITTVKPTDWIRYHDLYVSGECRIALVGNWQLDLWEKEFDLLFTLMSKPNRIFSRSYLLDIVWGKDNFPEERTVDVHIKRLRDILQDHGYGGVIVTSRGCGYKFSVDFLAPNGEVVSVVTAK